MSRACLLPCHPAKPGSEAGFLLAGSGVLILVIIALLGSFAFVATRNAHFHANYATGQRIADMTTLAHVYAQQQVYDGPGGTVNGVTIYSSTAPLGTNPMNPPDGFGFSNVANIRYSVEIIGQDQAPINASVDPSVKAASAYLHIRIRTPPGSMIAPSDRIALLAGAANRGLSRVGFYQTNIPAGDTCDLGGQPTLVRWGPESSSCLNATHLSALGFTDVQPGDIIVPVWETALARATDDAVYRYRQPERPDMNVMNTALKMNGNGPNPIAGAKHAYATTLHEDTGTATLKNMMVRNGQSLDLQQPALFDNTATSDPLRVYSQSGTPTAMQVNGPVSFTGGNVNVGNALQETAPMIVQVTDPGGFNADVVASKDPNATTTIVTSTAPQTLIGADAINPASNISGLQVQGSGKSLAVTGVIGNAAPINLGAGANGALDIYASQLSTNGSGPTDPNIALNVGSAFVWVSSIEQTGTGPDHSLEVPDMNVSIKCDGDACPDKSTTNPGGSPL